MFKCKNCFGQLEDKGEKFVCPFCYATYSRFEIESGGKSSKAINKGSVTERRSEEMNGDQIYDLCIRGSAVISCLDLGCAGSGFLAIDDRIVITNAHVVTSENGTLSNRIMITIAERQYRASVVKCGKATGLDVAFLRVESNIPDARPLTLGDSSTVRNGETVYAIGNSMGDGLCIVKGIVSDNRRQMNGRNYIMCDVATNQGNSGGPLIDTRGRVIAICVSQRIGNDYGVAGMRYFIPINDAISFWREG